MCRICTAWIWFTCENIHSDCKFKEKNRWSISSVAQRIDTATTTICISKRWTRCQCVISICYYYYSIYPNVSVCRKRLSVFVFYIYDTYTHCNVYRMCGAHERRYNNNNNNSCYIWFFQYKRKICRRLRFDYIYELG